ncbi:MAG TPA: hypothetical protein VH592_04695 [Gemmataceae bacterium]
MVDDNLCSRECIGPVRQRFGECRAALVGDVGGAWAHRPIPPQEAMADESAHAIEAGAGCMVAAGYDLAGAVDMFDENVAGFPTYRPHYATC